MSRSTLASIPVVVPGRTYEVLVGRGALAGLPDVLAEHPARQVAVVSAGVPAAVVAPRVVELLAATGRTVATLAIEDTDEAKTTEALVRVWRWFATLPLTRSDVVVAVGGGVVGDLVGFAAATWNRGVDLVQVPTTLLAQVDASVGGKTAVNLPEGKNLVGAFHQPLGVVADVDLLASLPPRERRSGLAEVLKCGYLADASLLTDLAATAADPERHDPDVDAGLVERAVRVKAAVVGADERESGLRALLNYGHTVGHAIEAAGRYTAHRHGEAVAVGMVAAASIGERTGVSPRGLADDTRDRLARLGLPTVAPGLDRDAVWAALGRDKKVRDGLRFVLVEEPGRRAAVHPVARDVVATVLDEVTPA